MRSSIFALLCGLMFVAAAGAQDDGYGFQIITPPPAMLQPAVTYLDRAPLIDGRLDDDLRSLPVRHFNLLYQSSDTNPVGEAAFRLAYGADFFYLHIEVQADLLICRDRAYQNGDGFFMVIAAPRPDNAPSDEFYVLACSAVDNPRMEWSRRIFWYYNVTHIFRPVSEETRLATASAEGKISFELLIPWKDLHPYHPWLSDGIGFNLTLVRAIGETDQNRYQVQSDHPDRENYPRNYTRLEFEPPVAETAIHCFARPARSTVAAGETVEFDLATFAPTAMELPFSWAVISGEGTRLQRDMTTLSLPAGLSRQRLNLKTGGLMPGGYRLAWQGGTDRDPAGSGLTILPVFDAAELYRRLAAAQGALSPASVDTLAFLIGELDAELAKHKPYETAAAQRDALALLKEDLEVVAAADDPFARRTGFLRKAYRSKLDGLLQPYTVSIPQTIDPARRYPLIVYLHGSASDEMNLAGALRVLPADKAIILGPRGRGPSNCWSADNAQTDIAEAIEAVCSSYPIDRGKIILSGFSMGGYGVLRGQFETPGKYAALALFSGGPDIGPRWLGPEHPDFTQSANLDVFKGMPIFIFHGKRDRNVPFEKTESLVRSLRAAGATVEYVSDPDRGHEQPGPEAIARLRTWLLSQFSK